MSLFITEACRHLSLLCETCLHSRRTELTGAARLSLPPRMQSAIRSHEANELENSDPTPDGYP
jgi:hypothetical protein